MRFAQTSLASYNRSAWHNREASNSLWGSSTFALVHLLVSPKTQGSVPTRRRREHLATHRCGGAGVSDPSATLLLGTDHTICTVSDHLHDPKTKGGPIVGPPPALRLGLDGTCSSPQRSAASFGECSGKHAGGTRCCPDTTSAVSPWPATITDLFRSFVGT